MLSSHRLCAAKAPNSPVALRRSVSIVAVAPVPAGFASPALLAAASRMVPFSDEGENGTSR